MNTSFKRFRLVEEDQFNERDRQKVLRDYNPELSTELRKQDLLKETIEDESLPPEMKLKIIRIMQHSLQPIERSVKPQTLAKNFTIDFTQPEFKRDIPLPVVQQAIPNQPVQQAVQAAQPALIGSVAAPAIGSVQAQVQGLHAPQRQNPNVQAGLAVTMQPVSPQRVAGAARRGQVQHQQLQQQQQQQQGLPFEDIVQTFPTNIQQKLRQITDIIQNHPNIIRFNDEEEVIIDNQIIPNSSIVELLKFLTNPRNSNDLPIGGAKFLRAIATLNIPFQMIGNKNVQNYLREAYQTGQGKARKKPIGFAKRPIPSKPPKKLSNKRGKLNSNSNSFKNLNLFKI